MTRRAPCRRTTGVALFRRGGRLALFSSWCSSAISADFTFSDSEREPGVVPCGLSGSITPARKMLYARLDAEPRTERVFERSKRVAPFVAFRSAKGDKPANKDTAAYSARGLA